MLKFDVRLCCPQYLALCVEAKNTEDAEEKAWDIAATRLPSVRDGWMPGELYVSDSSEVKNDERTQKRDPTEVNCFVLISFDRDMCPKYDLGMTSVFTRREDAIIAMERAIREEIESRQLVDADVRRNAEHDYAVSLDGRFVWKIEERILNGSDV